MRILKEYKEFANSEFDQEIEDLVDIRDLLLDIEKEAASEISNLDFNDTELDVQGVIKRFHAYFLVDEIGEISYRNGKLLNFLNFIIPD